MTGKLEGKIAVVTGGTSGIGLATAKLFASEGATVYITGRRQPELDAAVLEIGGAIGVQVDSSKLEDIDAFYLRVKVEQGRIDVLFTNAGVGSRLPLGEITEAHYHDIFDSNVKGTLFTVQQALPLLAKNASVILSGSTAGSTGKPAFSVYAASKAAVRAFARCWILDLKDRNVRVNTISPGATRTPGLFNLAGPDAEKQKAMIDYLGAQIPLGRIGEPEEVAKAALFLASRDASFINGIELFVDGGQAQF